MNISSDDLIESARDLTEVAAARIEDASKSDDPIVRLRLAEKLLVDALADLRVARWSIERRMPPFDPPDLDRIRRRETDTIHAHGLSFRSREGLRHHD